MIEFRFAFWQVLSEADCERLPSPDASPAEILEMFAEALGWDGGSDASVTSVDRFASYYFQSVSEIGNFKPVEVHLTDLLEYPNTDTSQTYAPRVAVDFHLEAMLDIRAWVSHKAEDIVFVYGENDPWSAAPFAIGADADSRSVAKYVVPGGNHRSTFLSPGLPIEARDEAFSQLEAWTGVTPEVPSSDVVQK